MSPAQRNVSENARFELRRLVNQSPLIGNVSAQIMQRAGIKPGMSVLDCGCGGGEASFAAARLVGSSGKVVGIDQSGEGIARARERAAFAGLKNVSFEISDLASFTALNPVDAVVGRLILTYLRDPATVLNRVARHVRPGGLIVFQELVLSLRRSEPPSPLVQKCCDWIYKTFVLAGADVDMGWKLSATFQRAGLPCPQMFLGLPVRQKPNPPKYQDIAETVRNLLPVMEHYGVALAEEVIVDSLTDRLRRQMTAVGTVCETPVLIGAWTRKNHSSS